MRVIQLTKGHQTVVDADDYEYLAQWRWKLHPQGYAARSTWDAGDRKWVTVLMHRLIAHTPAHLQTDHINRDRLDNRRSNLRNVTPSVNTWNQGMRSDNTSGVRGVCFDRTRRKWKATHGKRSLGRFDSFAEAVAARRLAEAVAA